MSIVPSMKVNFDHYSAFYMKLEWTSIERRLIDLNKKKMYNSIVRHGILNYFSSILIQLYHFQFEWALIFLLQSNIRRIFKVFCSENVILKKENSSLTFINHFESWYHVIAIDYNFSKYLWLDVKWIDLWLTWKRSPKRMAAVPSSNR